ncbi:MAG: MFS transporter [Deltaproteobacteria bacterium]|nr:MFS transporter [Deltaproteobacteria bacterium]
MPIAYRLSPLFFKYMNSPYILLLGICSARALLYLSLQNYPALIPVLQKEWQMSNAAAGSILSVFHMGFVVSLVGLSVLTDWVSTKKVFLYSCIAFAISGLLFALFARSYHTALLFRGLMGLALGGTYTPGLKLISEAFSSTLRGRAMGFFIGAGSIGHAGSLAVTGWIAAHYGWPAAFFVTSLGSFLGAVVPFIVLRGMEEKKPEPEERKFKKELLTNRPALLMIAGYSAHAWELEGMRAWTPAFLIACYLAVGSPKDHAIQAGSSFSSALYIMGVFSTLIAGYLSDRLGRTTVIISMMAISIVCSFSFGWLIGSPMAWVMILGLSYGFSVIAESPVFSSGLTEVVSPHYLGTALGLRSLIGLGIAALAPTLFGLILDLTNPGQGEKVLGYLPNWGWAFSMLGLVALVGPWTMFKLRALPESVKMAGGKK